VERNAHRQPADAAIRERALDIGRSFIVQAPAGSGKTELLIRRILALLAAVEKPEEILAITFTRKAAGEMKVRLLDALEMAAEGNAPLEEHKRQTWELARAALANDQARGWELRGNPARLQVMTIDSFCLSLTRRMPWLARLGEQPGISEDADALYRQAAENLLLKLEKQAAPAEQIRFMLQHLDNRMVTLRGLLTDMLARRDQWLRHLLDESGQSRRHLETALAAHVTTVLEDVSALLGYGVCRELVELATFATSNLVASGKSDKPICIFDGFDGRLEPLPQYRDHWLALADLLLTGQGTLRRQVNVGNGFPADKKGDPPLMKQRMLDLLAGLAEDEECISALRGLKSLPRVTFSEEQWQALQCLVELLPRAVVELKEVFREAGQVDFIEIAGSAKMALGSIDAPEELLLQMDSRLSHILVDEYQDTSYTQYDLLMKLTAGWQPDDGRTLFVVGDPMQSIYRFREADVGLFLKAQAEGIGTVRMEALTLTTNFRSRTGLVEWFNAKFITLFPHEEEVLTGAVAYAPAVAQEEEANEGTIGMTWYDGRDDVGEAEMVLSLIAQAQKDDPDATLAVLVRSRSHLKEVIRLFRERKIPFQAQELALLGDRPIAQDLLALTRALLHPGDSIAWLSLLRAPWCGLSLDDLCHLVESASGGQVYDAIFKEPTQVDMFTSLSREGQRRVERLRKVALSTVNGRGRVGLRHLVESAWIALGGPAVIDGSALVEAEQVFSLLDQLDHGGDLPVLDDIAKGFEKLYAAADPEAGSELQVMTIHRAKGLEFDTVIVPGLGRLPRRGDKPLLRWLEHPDYGLMMSPVPPAEAEKEDAIYRAIGEILDQRDRHETLRLFYVAATRARKALHLLGHVRQADEDDYTPSSGSLLDTIWPAVSQDVPVLAVDEKNITEDKQKSFVRRLPDDWSLPELAPSVRSTVKAAASASDIGAGVGQEPVRFSLKTEEGRQVGTIVHRWLERYAREGVDQGVEGLDKSSVERIRRQLTRAGVVASQIDHAVDRVRTCLQNALQSERGQWLLSPHEEHACELEISGVVHNELVHGSIDRTFIADGIRWVVDYKTTAPAKGESVDGFLVREENIYREQVQTYVELFRHLEERREVRGALYFPTIDSWYEIAC